MAELDYQNFQQRKRFKRKGTQTCSEIALGVTQLLITKGELEIYFHRFDEFFKTLKFQIKNKSEFSASINFAFPKKDMLLEIGLQSPMPWENSIHENCPSDQQILNQITLSSFPSDQSSWGSSFRLGSELNARVNSRKSLFSNAQSPICKRQFGLISSDNSVVHSRENAEFFTKRLPCSHSFRPEVPEELE